MKSDRIFIGNIKKCTVYDEHSTFSSSFYIGDRCITTESYGTIGINSEMIKKNAVLLRLTEGGYVDLESLNSYLDYLKARKDVGRKGFRLGRLILPDVALGLDYVFVDRHSLKQYYSDKSKKQKVSVRRLIKQLNASKQK